MRFRLSIPFVFLGAIVALGPTSSGDVVDQAQLANSADIANFSQPDLAQSFTPSYDNVSGAAIQLNPGGMGIANITISLYTQLPNQNGTALESATDAAVSPGTWATVEFTSPVPVVAGNTYYLVFTSTNSTFGILGSTANPYPGGETFANDGYQPFAAFDYAFETFSNPDGPLSSAPLPPAAGAGLALLGGLGAFTLARRRNAPASV